jgi:cytochrome c biogenesis protein CcdA
MLTYIFALLAGVLSILSPCILPLLPILISSGTQAGGWRSVIGLPIGMGLSFTIVGIALASVGHFLGLDGTKLNIISSVLLIVFGLVLLINQLQQGWIILTQKLSNIFSNKASNISSSSFISQFCIGLLLGIAWTPCIGPTIGAAITLASKGEQLWHSAIIMLLFALGATLPVVCMTFLSKKTLLSYKSSLQFGGRYGKIFLGVLLVVWGIGLLFNLDKHISAWLLQVMPSWLSTYI